MKNWLKYIVGLLLTYGICVLLGGKSLSTEFGTAIQLGLIMGILFFIILGPIHFFLQLTGHFIITRVKPSINRRAETIILNVPAFSFFIILLISAATPMSATAMRVVFREHLNNSMPASVIVKGYQMQRGMNDGTYIFLFSISKSDLDQLMKSQGYALQDSHLDEAKMNHYQQTVQKLTSQPFSLTPPLTIYFSETNTGSSKFQKSIIVSSNQEDALFVENFF